MNDSRNYIHPRERLALILLSGVLSLIVLAPISSEIIDNYNDSVGDQQYELKCQSEPSKCVRFAADHQKRSHPLFHLLALFIFIGIVRAKRYLVFFC